MNLLQQFILYIRQQHLFSPKDTLLLAVSGGMDSVVLCELCYQSGFDFIIAHCNFQLRGGESDRDENFVKQLGEKYGKRVVVKRFETEKYAVEHKVSIQVAARELRYSWLHTLITPNSQIPTPDSRLRTPDSILTAHHLDDNIETMLLNFFKGTGVSGLRGMLPRQGKIIRPLLFAGKEELKTFAMEHHLNWVEDSSNASDKYSRNYFRNQVIPLVQKIYPAATGNLANNLERFRDIELLYHQSINLHKKKLLEQKGDEVHIPVLKLKKSVPLQTIVFEIIKGYHFSAAQAEEIVHLLDSESGKFIRSSTHRILKNRNWLIISPNPDNKSSQTILIEESTPSVGFENGILKIDKLPAVNCELSTDNCIALLDADKISFPLLLRKWKPGDYFYPLGMTRKKKLNRFFIDNKLSRGDKEKAWVLEMDKKMIWVIGWRIDDRFKITPQTQNILQVKVEVGVL